MARSSPRLLCAHVARANLPRGNDGGVFGVHGEGGGWGIEGVRSKGNGGCITMFTTCVHGEVVVGGGDFGAAVGGRTAVGVDIDTPIARPVGCSPDSPGVGRRVRGSFAGTIGASVGVPTINDQVGGVVVGHGETGGGNNCATMAPPLAGSNIA